MRYFVSLSVAVTIIGAAGCASEATTPSYAAIQVDVAAATSGRRAAERFMETWNTRDPEVWASSLNFPHARPAAGAHRVWQTRDEYVSDTDYASVIATGWDHTEFEELRTVHEGDRKAHIAGRWGRVDAAGTTIRRNLVAYVATKVDEEWGIQARFGAGAPLSEDQAKPIAAIAIAKVEQCMMAFNARDPVAWAATLNYPHLRFESGELKVWTTEEQLAAGMDFETFGRRFGWDHSKWDEIEAIQVAEKGVNVALTISHNNADDELVSTFNTLYLVTNENGRWGIRPRSSFAP